MTHHQILVRIEIEGRRAVDVLSESERTKVLEGVRTQKGIAVPLQSDGAGERSAPSPAQGNHIPEPLANRRVVGEGIGGELKVG